MSEQSALLPISPLISIHTWSKNRPPWQQDALRRIVTVGSLAEVDFTQLESICRLEHGALDEEENAANAVPLEDTHLPSTSILGGGVSLMSLSKVNNVNRLLANQVLTFEPGPKLTIIYGNNGAGKSGYARVIKKACRCRGKAAAILPDVRSTQPLGKASASFVIRENNADQTIEWREDGSSDRRLGNIFVFDTQCSDHYIEEDDGTAFIPFGLDVLGKLGESCENLKLRLTERQRGLRTAIEDTKRGWRLQPDTITGTLVESLAASTDPSTIDAASVWTEADANHLKELRETLGSNPKLRAQRTRSSANRIQGLLAAVQKSLSQLDTEKLEAIRQAVSEADEARKVAETCASDQFEGTFLSGTGSDVWSRLWAAARDFSTKQGYPEKTFPNIGADARCVLCQSFLDEDDRARLRRFDEFVADRASQFASDTKRRVANLTNELATLTPLSPEWKRVESDFADVSNTHRDLIVVFVTESDRRREAIIKAIDDDSWSLIPSPPPSPVPILESLLVSLDQRAITEETAADPEKQQRLTIDKNEHEAREWLSMNKPSVLHQIARLRKDASLQKCIDDTNTLAISKKNKALFATHVTDAFRQRFSDEVAFLELEGLQVELLARGEKGSTRFGLRLTGATTHPLVHVASEGEKRGISLALFLAELAQASHSSALVFDDPVSSLDHERRSRIAERLVREAKVRQVIVFTHDLSLVYQLQYHSKSMAVEVHGRHIDRFAGSPGRCTDGFPENAQTCKTMMKQLRESCNKAKSAHRRGGESEYDEIARQICDKIRAATEQIVEEFLFDGVLCRQDNQIKMGKLESVGSVEKADYQAIHAVWRECSQVIASHANPRANPPTIPNPARLDQLVANLGEVMQRVKNRRKPETQTMTPSVGLSVVP